MTGAHAAATPVATALLGAAGTAVLRGLHRRGRWPGGSARWERTNHRGDPVTLTEGVALAVGTSLPLVVVDPPAACAVLQAGAVGALDDLGGGSAAKGLRGHLAALGRGQVTTGAIKVVVLVEAGLVSVLWSDRRAGRPLGMPSLAGAALVAGGANLANLFDLRPGRALKVGLALALPLGAHPAAAAIAGAGSVVLPDDLAGASMLGDTGANALGAAVGLAAAQRLGGRGRGLALGAVVGLTLLSEKVSFTQVIERTPVLRELDRWGRA